MFCSLELYLEVKMDLEFGKFCNFLSNLHCNRVVCLKPTSPTTPNKTHAPLDWASGVTTKPDPSVINKHIRKVVDVRVSHVCLF